MKIIIIFLIVSMLSIYSCSILQTITPNYIKEEFTFLYDGRDMGTDTLMDIQGAYVIPKKTTNHIKEITSYTMIILFNDGIAVRGALNVYDTTNLCYQKITPQLLNDMVIRDQMTEELPFFYQLHIWGIYKIKGDTIKIQYVSKPISLNDDWSMSENWYKIIDKNNIIEIVWNRYDRDRKKWIKIDYTEQQIPLPSIYIPLKEFPSSDSWIKEESWFWKNESDWKEYMKQFKNK